LPVNLINYKFLDFSHPEIRRLEFGLVAMDMDMKLNASAASYSGMPQK